MATVVGCLPPGAFETPASVLERIRQRPDPASWLRRSQWQDIRVEPLPVGCALADLDVVAKYPKGD